MGKYAMPCVKYIDKSLTEKGGWISCVFLLSSREYLMLTVIP